MNPVELIRKKRDGTPLQEEEIRHLITSYVDGSLPDYQMSAFLMACYFKGMTSEETLAFTKAMLHSGEVLDLSAIPGVKVDKHSTGGVGDKVSIILAPLVAACGVPVPMISGRGLGHTGGTLDKLESIPGFRTNLSIAEYRKVIASTGLVMIGQTAEIAPADKSMYALRDVTATVESIPLIAGSIMSKKLAEGIDALVLDVKTGRGAFMQTYQRSLELARTLVGIGTGFGKSTMAFLTRMDRPLGVAVGNWLEVVECVECLRGERGEHDASADLMELTYVLAGAMVFLGKKASTVDAGIVACRAALKSGAAYRALLRLVEAQGGDVKALEHLEQYPVADHLLELHADEGGFVQAVDAFEVGMCAIALGAGRQRMDDIIDPKAGILLHKNVGDAVAPSEPLATLHTDRPEALESVRYRLQRAFAIGRTPPQSSPLILNVVDSTGVHPWPR